jgi:hypothetical protein
MICVIVSTVTTEPGGYSRGVAHAVNVCTTHNWHLGSGPTSEGFLCPIGRIEEARDLAIAAIQQEAANATSNRPPSV